MLVKFKPSKNLAQCASTWIPIAPMILSLSLRKLVDLTDSLLNHWTNYQLRETDISDPMMYGMSREDSREAEGDEVMVAEVDLEEEGVMVEVEVEEVMVVGTEVVVVVTEVVVVVTEVVVGPHSVETDLPIEVAVG